VEETERKASPESTEAMNLSGLNWVINLQPVQEFARERVDERTNDSHDESSPWLNVGATSCDGYCSCEKSI